MKIDKFLYFRQVTDEANDGLQSANASNENPASLLVPASSLCAMHPTGDTTLSLYFKPVRAIYGAAETIRDRVDLTVTEGDIFEVMTTITAAINAGPHSDGFITIADDAASGGTEIVGEDVAGNVSVPDNDLDLDAAAGVLGSVITMGTLANVQRGTDETFLHVTAKEDLSSMTGTPKVGVYVKYIGGAPILL